MKSSVLIAAFQNMLRKWNSQDYYYATLTPGDKEHMRSHIGTSGRDRTRGVSEEERC